MSKKIKFSATYHWKSSDHVLGRFGGGWQWKLGFSAGGSTLILHCLVFDIRLEREA